MDGTWHQPVETGGARETGDLAELCRSLQHQVTRLTEELAAVYEELTEERMRARIRDRIEVLDPADVAGPADAAANVYVFEDGEDDESRDAFDEFFAAPDPHLDKVRGFLLD